MAPSKPTPTGPIVSRHRRTVLIAAAAVLFILVLTTFKGIHRTSDFTVYFRAAGEIASGRSPYDLVIPGEDRLRYVYPPLLAALLAPVSGLPEGAAAAGWAVLNLAALLGSLVLLRRFLDFHPDPLPVVAVSFLAVVPFVRGGFRSGQVAAPLLFLILYALLEGGRGRPVRSGAALGGAAAVKLYPAAAVLGWVAAGRWRPVVAAAGFGLGLSVLVPAAVMGPARAAEALTWFWTGLVPRALGGEAAPGWFGARSRHSQSLPSAVYRWVGTGGGGSGSKILIVCLSAVGVGVLLWLAVRALRRLEAEPFDGDPRKPLLQAALVVGLLPILGPVSLKPAFMALLPVWAVLFALPAGGRGRRDRAVILLGAAGLVLHLAPVRLLFGRAAAHGLEASSSVLLGTVAIYLAMVLRVGGLTRVKQDPARRDQI